MIVIVQKSGPWIALAAALMMLNCGGDGGGAAADSCAAVCEVQANGADCPADNSEFLQMCRMACGVLFQAMSADCRAKAEAQNRCLQQQTFKCSSGGNLAQPEDPQACREQSDAFQPCMQQQPAQPSG